jgi:hypothetical protein
MWEGVAALVGDMRTIAGVWKLDSVAATRRLPDGHMLSIAVAGEVITIERDDGVMVSIPPDALLRGDEA